MRLNLECLESRAVPSGTQIGPDLPKPGELDPSVLTQITTIGFWIQTGVQDAAKLPVSGK